MTIQAMELGKWGPQQDEKCVITIVDRLVEADGAVSLKFLVIALDTWEVELEGLEFFFLSSFFFSPSSFFLLLSYCYHFSS